VIENRGNADKSGVDRTKTCPVLLRVFIGRNRHNALPDYTRGKTPSNELQIYTWIDASLKEIASLIRAVHPDSRRRGTSFQFSIVFADPSSRNYRTRDIGMTTPGQPSPDDQVTLASKRFQIGDYLDVAISVPQEAGGGGAMRGRRFGRVRPY